MSSSSRARTNLGMISALSAHEVLNSDDAMCEILLLLPPETIYKLILVSKRWLQIIANPFFRNTYLTKWKQSFHLIGFFICNSMYLGKRVDGVRRPRSEPSLPLLSTSSIGDEIESSSVLKKLGYYIDSSNGLLLCGRHPKAYYLWDPNTKKHHQIPRPRVHFEELVMSLITEDSPSSDNGVTYKVIRAECVSYMVHSTKVRVETFSSKTTTWSYAELTCPEPLSISPWTPGRVIGSVVYWHATGGKVAIHDTNDESKRITLIKLPKAFDYDEQVLGESADGCLQYGWSNKSVMEIWKLDSDSLQWVRQYKMSFKVMWRMNPVEATRFSVKTKETQLLAFLNQKSDCVYIRNDSHIFVCNLETQKVEDVQYQGRGSSFVWEFCKVLPYFRPAWPSSPSLLKIESLTSQCDGSSSVSK